MFVLLCYPTVNEYGRHTWIPDPADQTTFTVTLAGGFSSIGKHGSELLVSLEFVKVVTVK